LSLPESMVKFIQRLKRNCILSGAISTICLVSIQLIPVQSSSALPGMTVPEVQAWARKSTTIKSLKSVKKYTADYPDYDSQFQTNAGRVYFSVYLDEHKKVETEGIEYRPNCPKNVTCKSNLKFEKADNGLGKSLIKQVFGEQISNDFTTAKPIESISVDYGLITTNRWYEGKSYKYTTSHTGQNVIVQFHIHPKTVSFEESIRSARFCAKNPRDRSCISI
jgi:hypothetical protein